MKRRKTLNKFSVNANGQIECKSSRPLSNRTQKMLDFMMFAQMYQTLLEQSKDESTDEESSIEEETSNE